MKNLLRPVWLCCLWISGAQLALAQDGPDANASVQRAWFRPSLSIDNDPSCAAVLSTVDERFRSTKSLGFNHYPRESYKLGRSYPTSTRVISGKACPLRSAIRSGTSP